MMKKGRSSDDSVESLVTIPIDNKNELEVLQNILWYLSKTNESTGFMSIIPAVLRGETFDKKVKQARRKADQYDTFADQHDPDHNIEPIQEEVLRLINEKLKKGSDASIKPSKVAPEPASGVHGHEDEQPLVNSDTATSGPDEAMVDTLKTRQQRIIEKFATLYQIDQGKTASIQQVVRDSIPQESMLQEIAEQAHQSRCDWIIDKLSARRGFFSFFRGLFGLSPKEKQTEKNDQLSMADKNARYINSLLVKHADADAYQKIQNIIKDMATGQLSLHADTEINLEEKYGKKRFRDVPATSIIMMLEGVEGDNWKESASFKEYDSARLAGDLCNKIISTEQRKKASSGPKAQKRHDNNIACIESLKFRTSKQDMMFLARVAQHLENKQSGLDLSEAKLIDDARAILNDDIDKAQNIHSTESTSTVDKDGQFTKEGSVEDCIQKSGFGKRRLDNQRVFSQILSEQFAKAPLQTNTDKPSTIESIINQNQNVIYVWDVETIFPDSTAVNNIINAGCDDLDIEKVNHSEFVKPKDNINQSIIGQLSCEEGRLKPIIALDAGTSGQSSTCVPFYDPIQKRVVADIIKQKDPDTSSILPQNGYIIHETDWLGQNLENIDDKVFNGIVNRVGILPLFASIANNEINKGELNGDLKLDNILIDPSTARISVVDNDYEEYEYPDGLKTGLLIDPSTKLYWDELGKRDLSKEKSVDSVLDLWSLVNDPVNHRSSGSPENTISKVQDKYTENMCKMISGEAMNTPETGEGLMLQSFWLGPNQMSHDAFALCTVGQMQAIRALLSAPSKSEAKILKQTCLQIQKGMLQDLGQAIQSMTKENQGDDLGYIEKMAIIKRIHIYMNIHGFKAQDKHLVVDGLKQEEEIVTFTKEVNEDLSKVKGANITLTTDQVTQYLDRILAAQNVIDQYNQTHDIDWVKQTVQKNINQSDHIVKKQSIVEEEHNSGRDSEIGEPMAGRVRGHSLGGLKTSSLEEVTDHESEGRSTPSTPSGSVKSGSSVDGKGRDSTDDENTDNESTGDESEDRSSHKKK